MICPGFIDLKGNNQDVKDRIKTYLFKSAFKCREDVIAKYWQSKSGKSGYSPLCRNEWKKGICKKPCRSCQNADYIPLSDQLVLDHFKGKIILGIYPLLKDGTCWFIAGDFDNHTGDRSPLDDVRAYYEACQVQDIPCYALKSKSGKGYHTYIFFDSPVPAWKARIVAFALLQEAGVTGADAELSSFDRLFPNQDELTGKELGNLIALPFQGQAARADRHTLLLNPKSQFSDTFRNQWDELARIQRISENVLDDIIKTWNLKKDQNKRNSGNGTTNPEGWLLEALKGVEEGNPSRDVTGAKIAGYFLDKLPKKDISTILLAWNAHNKPPLEETDIHKIVQSVFRYKNNVEPNVKRAKINISFG
jgi:hypothetical protein